MDILTENNYHNFSSATNLPVLIPVRHLPLLSQPYLLYEIKQTNHLLILIGIIVGCALLIALLAMLLVYAYRLRKKKKSLNRKTEDKLLYGVSCYVSKPTMYKIDVIMEATMKLDEGCKIGKSVYRAEIEGQVFAVKKVKDVTEELRILQKVNHANLVKIMGVSSDNDGNHFLVYEYAENGSLDNWLYAKCRGTSSSKAFLARSQRISTALDVALGLQCMHDHTQPRLVHRYITTSNILLQGQDCEFLDDQNLYENCGAQNRYFRFWSSSVRVAHRQESHGKQ